MRDADQDQVREGPEDDQGPGELTPGGWALAVGGGCLLWGLILGLLWLVLVGGARCVL
jgi:hypothetical protein